MNIKVTACENTKCIALDGRLDTSAAPRLTEVLEEELKGDIKKLIFDMKDCSYIASSGLRVILQAQKKMNQMQGTMVVKNVNEIVMGVFEMTGFTDILTIE